MSKKILAIALFAVMVLSLVPFASAAASDGAFGGAEAVNVNTPGTSDAAKTGDVWAKTTTDTVNIVIEKGWNDLYKASTGWYTADEAKFSIYVYLYNDVLTGAELTNLTVNGSNRDIASNSSVESTAFLGVYSTVEDPAEKLFGETSGDEVTAIHVKDFVAKRGGNQDKYTITYKIDGDASTRTIYVNITYKDSDGADKPEQPMWVKLSNAGDSGLYNVYTVNGVIYIDYANDIEFTSKTPVIPIKFDFYSDAAGTSKLPVSGQRAKINDGSHSAYAAGKFFTTSLTAATDAGVGTTNATMGVKYFNTNMSDAAGYNFLTGSETGFTSSKTLFVNVPNSSEGTKNQTFSIKLETNDYFYSTGDVKVVWRPVPRNQITNVVISQRNITLKVGETVKLEVLPTMQTTYSTLKLQDSAAVPFVYVDGMSITGSRIGTTALNVYFGNQAIDAITVTVVAADSTTTPTTDNQWRVLARSLNVRTGPGTGYAKVGTLSMNSVVTGIDTGLGWIELSNGTYISKQYAVPVNAAAATGNYVTTASSLNVRSGPGSSYGKIGSLPKGSVVSVLAIQGSWAQTNAGWVSTLYLNAI